MSGGGALRVGVRPGWRAPAQNPYVHLLHGAIERLGPVCEDATGRRLARERFDIVHLHWPESVLRDPRGIAAGGRALFLLTLLDRQRRRGARVVFTLHNLRHHEGRHPRLEPWFWRLFLRRVDGALALSRAGLELARERHPQLETVPAAVTPHGHYRDVVRPPMSRDRARDHLGLGRAQSVAAFVGKVRPYKEVPTLLRAFRTLPDPTLALVVAGEPRAGTSSEELVAAADTRVRLLLRSLSDSELSTVVQAADLVVFPSSDAYSSGTAMLALSLDRPVLLPATPTMRELQQDVGEAWVRLFVPPLTADALAAALSLGVPPARALDDRFDWANVAADTVAFYRQVLEARPGGRAGQRASRSEP